MKRDLNRRSSTGPPFISWLSIRWTCCLISVMVSSPLDWSRSLETQDCKELKALFIVGIFWSLENESSRKIQHGEETLSDILSGIHHPFQLLDLHSPKVDWNGDFCSAVNEFSFHWPSLQRSWCLAQRTNLQMSAVYLWMISRMDSFLDSENTDREWKKC